jgi:hypothetical protein
MRTQPQAHPHVRIRAQGWRAGLPRALLGCRPRSAVRAPLHNGVGAVNCAPFISKIPAALSNFNSMAWSGREVEAQPRRDASNNKWRERQS